MVHLLSLWLPIVLSAVFVYVASTIIHMVLGYHRGDLRKLPREAEVLDALRPFEIPPGDYAAPLAGSMSAMKDPEFIAKMEKGPVAFMTVVPNGPPKMGKSLLLWFVYLLVVSGFTAYVACHVLSVGAPYRPVFRLTGCVAFAGYSLALLQNGIWWRRNWRMTLLGVFDGLIYGLLTAGTFGWLWPR